MRFTILLLDLFDLIAFLLFVVGIVLTIRFFIFNPYTVVGQSMEPNFEQGDFIIVDKVTPRYGTLDRGDILVFVPDMKDVPYIKRIVGMPGETVVINKSKMYLCPSTKQITEKQGDLVDISNCEKVEEDYLPANTKTEARCNKSIFPVKDETYFVVGDNRAHSTDSRCCFGSSCYEEAPFLVRPENIIGKVALRLYPSVNSF